MRRKVLSRPDFGLCVLLPKALWPSFSHAEGMADVLVNGAPVVVTVRSEACDCRGTGIHEHRFLSFPTGVVQKGETIGIEF
jgi:hypothetical protein